MAGGIKQLDMFLEIFTSGPLCLDQNGLEEEHPKVGLERQTCPRSARPCRAYEEHQPYSQCDESRF